MEDPGAPDVAAVRDVLDRMGSPEAILPLSLGPIAGLFEIGLRQGGWLLALLTAATLVVRSAMWSRREKLVGLLVVPAATLACCTALAWRVTASGIPGFDVFLLGSREHWAASTCDSGSTRGSLPCAPADRTGDLMRVPCRAPTLTASGRPRHWKDGRRSR